MYSLNRATIIGNLTRDPELRQIPSGQSVASFAVATNRRWTDQSGNPQEQVEFHDIVAWGKIAEICQQILHKGNKVYVEGRLQTRSWEGQDGVKRYKTEIVAENFVALTPRTIDAVESQAAAPVPGAEIKAKEETGKKEDLEADKEEIDLDEMPF